MSSVSRESLNVRLADLFGMPSNTIRFQMETWLKEKCPEPNCDSCRKILSDLESYSNYHPFEGGNL